VDDDDWVKFKVAGRRSILVYAGQQNGVVAWRGVSKAFGTVLDSLSLEVGTCMGQASLVRKGNGVKVAPRETQASTGYVGPGLALTVVRSAKVSSTLGSSVRGRAKERSKADDWRQRPTRQ